MRKITFERVLPFLLLDEGGYSNRKKDRGGPTNKGITWKTYNAYRRRKGLPIRSVKQIEDHEVREIYRTEYWDEVRADELPEHLRYTVFDAAVNSGPERAIRLLQQVGKVDDDGIIGPKTLAAAEKVLLADYSLRRERWYEQIIDNDPEQEVNRRGWMNRVKKVHNRTITMLE